MHKTMKVLDKILPVIFKIKHCTHPDFLLTGYVGLIWQCTAGHLNPINHMWLKIFWQSFGRFGPFPLGVTQKSSGVKISKCFKWPFMYIKSLVRLWYKIYSLLCVGCMVGKILTKGHPKVKWVKFSTTSDLHLMTNQIVNLTLYIPKLYTFMLFWAFTFEIIPFVWIQTMIVVEEVLKNWMEIIDYKKSIIHITLLITLNDLSYIQLFPPNMDSILLRFQQ